MLIPRVIPVLLLRGGALVKTVQFRKPVYVGDPVNAVRIFNEKEVDELCILDIGASVNRHEPNFALLERVASECFMPLAYGGGITSVAQMRRLFSLGIEKVIVNSAAITNPSLIREAAAEFGSQSIVVSIDVERGRWGDLKVKSLSGQQVVADTPLHLAEKVVAAGAGEILLQSIDRDGTGQGLDLALIEEISRAVPIPVIAGGGAGNLRHVREAVDHGAHAVALGSMAVFFGRLRAVLINFPKRSEVEGVFGRKWVR